MRYFSFIVGNRNLGEIGGRGFLLVGFVYDFFYVVFLFLN